MRIVGLLFNFLLCLATNGQISLIPGRSCETKSSPFDRRVVGGTRALAEQAPWNVILERTEKTAPDSIVTHCGGSIVTETAVLTAAHCLWGNAVGARVCPENVRRLGSAGQCHRLGGGCPEGCLRIRPRDLNVYVGVTSIGQVERVPRKVKRVIIHEGWNKRSVQNDIENGHDLAIVVLEVELRFSERVKPICVPDDGLFLRAGRNVNINGFGYAGFQYVGNTRMAIKVQQLQHGTLQIVPTDDCIGGFNIQGDQLCAESDEVDSCNGDSGNGLVASVGSPAAQVLVGVTSFGLAECSGSGVYTNIRSHVGWIRQKLFNINSNRCLTISGPAPGSACIFPFTLKGKTFHGCTVEAAPDGQPWCSTKVDRQGNHITGEGFWGRCGVGCESDLLLMESSGPAAEYQGGRLGYFDLQSAKYNSRPAYRQKGNGDFLFYDDGRWWVCDSPGGTTCGFAAPRSAPKPPGAGWQFADGGGLRDVDPATFRLVLNPRDSSGCSVVTVSSSGAAGKRWPAAMGRFTWTGEWSRGRKLYSNGVKFLRVPTGKSNWIVGDGKDGAGGDVRSGRGTSCPCDRAAGPSGRTGANWWQYWDGRGWREDQFIRVTCD